jgi:hypothetical protein
VCAAVRADPDREQVDGDAVDPGFNLYGLADRRRTRGRLVPAGLPERRAPSRSLGAPEAGGLDHGATSASG